MVGDAPPLSQRPRHNLHHTSRSLGNADHCGCPTEVGQPNQLSQCAHTGQSWLDPEYRALEPWFEQMAKHFEEDIYAANELADCPPEYKEPDFIHEALQRLIFDFLMKHQGAQFMKLQKHTKNRTFKPLDTGPDLTPVTDSSGSEKRSRGTVERPEGDQGPRVSHIVLGQLLCPELTFGQRSNRVKQDAV